LIIILWTSGQVFGSKTTWKAYIMGQPNGSTDWNLASNWDNGVPTAMDSAIITGGTSNLNVNVLIISTVEAFHVTIEEHCILSILTSGNLLVIDSPVFGIKVDKYAQLINFGMLTSASHVTGIFVHGLLENYGEINTNLTINGIDFYGDGVGVNKGEIDIRNSTFGLSCSEDAQVTNEPDALIFILDCTRGMSTSGSAKFINNANVILTNLAIGGLYNNGIFINNNNLIIDDVDETLNSVGIFNGKDQPSDVGEFVNNLQILMYDIHGIALKLDKSTTFLNAGPITISDVNGVGLNGIRAITQSSFSITADGSLYLPLTYGTPLDIELGSVFNIDAGGILCIDN